MKPWSDVIGHKAWQILFIDTDHESLPDFMKKIALYSTFLFHFMNKKTNFKKLRLVVISISKWDN